MKKIISLLLVAAMSVSLVACSSKAQTNNEPQTNESGSQQETEDHQSEENSKQMQR